MHTGGRGRNPNVAGFEIERILPPTWHDALMFDVVSVNPNVLGGTPVFAGTRVPVESLFDYVKCGRTVDYFLEQFPTVSRDQVERPLDDSNAPPNACPREVAADQNLLISCAMNYPGMTASRWRTWLGRRCFRPFHRCRVMRSRMCHDRGRADIPLNCVSP